MCLTATRVRNTRSTKINPYGQSQERLTMRQVPDRSEHQQIIRTCLSSGAGTFLLFTCSSFLNLGGTIREGSQGCGSRRLLKKHFHAAPQSQGDSKAGMDLLSKVLGKHTAAHNCSLCSLGLVVQPLGVSWPSTQLSPMCQALG